MTPAFIIIGAGAAGCATALKLAEAGASVRLVDRQGFGLESSWAGGGILYPLLPWDYAHPVTDLVQRSLALYPDWVTGFSDLGIDPEYQRSGMLVLPPFDTQPATSWCGSHSTRLELPKARAILPELGVDQESLWLPDVAQARNPRLMKAMKLKLLEQGVDCSENLEVTGFQSVQGQITGIETPEGVLHAERYIVTAGAWSKALLGEHALELAIRPVRGQMLLFKTRPDTLRSIVLRNGIYLIPRRDGHILVGSTLEEAGFDKSTTQEAMSMLYREASEILPLLRDAPLVQHWSGLRPGSPDNIPVISRHPHFDNLFINSGHFRYGVTMAPASAEIMANLVLEQPQAIDIDPYRWPTGSK